MNQLDGVANDTDGHETNTNGSHDLQVLFAVGFLTLLNESATILDEFNGSLRKLLDLIVTLGHCVLVLGFAQVELTGRRGL